MSSIMPIQQSLSSKQDSALRISAAALVINLLFIIFLADRSKDA
jgi:hypothetical protein